MIYNKRKKTLGVRLQLITRLFYAAAGEYLLECSTTRAIEQFLMSRASDSSNSEALASAIKAHAVLQGKTPSEMLAEWLESSAGDCGIDDNGTAAIALCQLWGIDPDERVRSE